MAKRIVDSVVFTFLKSLNTIRLCPREVPWTIKASGFIALAREKETERERERERGREGEREAEREREREREREGERERGRKRERERERARRIGTFVTLMWHFRNVKWHFCTPQVTLL